MSVLCFIPEVDISHVQMGQEVHFKQNNTFEEFNGIVTDVRLSRAHYLLYPQLASVFSGPLPVTEEGHDKLAFVESYFPVEVVLEGDLKELRFGQTGQIIMEGPWRSKFMRMIRYIRSILWRESGF
jgi:hypothetical protein